MWGECHEFSLLPLGFLAWPSSFFLPLCVLYQVVSLGCPPCRTFACAHPSVSFSPALLILLSFFSLVFNILALIYFCSIQATEEMMILGFSGLFLNIFIVEWKQKNMTHHIIKTLKMFIWIVLHFMNTNSFSLSVLSIENLSSSKAMNCVFFPFWIFKKIKKTNPECITFFSRWTWV